MKFNSIFAIATLCAGITSASSAKKDANNIKQYRRSDDVPSVRALEFENFGFTGYYSMVSELKNVDSDSCTCELGSAVKTFSGLNAPLDEPVSVHFRGPLVLNKFAVYTSPDFVHGENLGSDWNRTAYYDASSSTAENVTFLTNAGDNSSCLGKALTYADSDGTSKASKATVLKENALITSNAEYSIFSNVSCSKSSFENDCGVYRHGIPAFHGYDGTIKTFLFQFTMPNETDASSDISNYNMPAIWLLNARIPRTAQYSQNPNCSCWRSGCGEFDIFEVKNNTGSQVGQLYSTIHDYQGTDDIEMGLQVDGYIPRNYDSTYSGGVTFDKNGNAVVFVSNSTKFDSTISASDLNSWISGVGHVVSDSLLSASNPAPTGASTYTAKKSDGYVVSAASIFTQIMTGLFGMAMWAF